ncbi:MAG TPA: hypothetical protein PK598_07210 [Thermoanaerobaculia bacterium]|nr:hypothetical protein [Thermoanaerobaculia bacterium]
MTSSWYGPVGGFAKEICSYGLDSQFTQPLFAEWSPWPRGEPLQLLRNPPQDDVVVVRRGLCRDAPQPRL